MTSNFVKIDNLSQSPIDIDAWMKKERNSKGFSPLFAYEVLKKTNHYANLKLVLREIFRQPQEDHFLYKSFVLAAIEGRVHSKEVYDGLHKLASEGGYLREFHKADEVRKVYYSKSCKVFYPSYLAGKTLTNPSLNYDTICIKSDNVEAFDDSESGTFYRGLTFGEDSVLPQYSYIQGFYKVSFEGCDLSKAESISLQKDTEVYFENIEIGDYFYKVANENKVVYTYGVDFDKIRNQKLEFGQDVEVYIYNSRNLPEYIDLSKVRAFRGDTTSYEGVKEIVLGKYVTAYWNGSNCLPEVIRLNGCKDVEISKCSFKNVKEFNINDVGRIRFKSIEDLDSCEIDFSKCMSVELFDCLYNRSGVKFAKGSDVTLGNVWVPVGTDCSECEKLNIKVNSNVFWGPKLNCKDLYINGCVHFPEEVDFSNVSHFEASACYFKNVKEMKLKKGAKARFVCCYVLPEVMDLSDVEDVRFRDCEYGNVKKIVFKNKAQLRKCVKNGLGYEAVKDKIEILEKRAFDKIFDFVHSM